VYDANELGISYDEGRIHHLTGSHYVLATDEELVSWN